VPVCAARSKRLKDEEVERALQQFDSIGRAEALLYDLSEPEP
jgi:hypothetical protein